MFTDFEFNGQRASDFGCMVCNFDGVGLETVSAGSNLVLNTVNKTMVNNFDIMSTKYDEPFTTTFQICKHTCKNYNPDTQELEEELIARMMRWLNKKHYRKFKMLYSDGKCSDIYYKGTFTLIQMITLGERVVGLELTFQANAPFGYYEPLEFYMEFPNTETEFCIYDTSDEEGFIYPSKVEITVLEDGDLEIYNSQEHKYTIIKNCIAGEMITLDGANKIILSNVAHPTIYNDFNYTFIRIMNKSGECDDYYGVNNEEDERENVFTVSLPCNIYLKYSPICKMGVI